MLKTIHDPHHCGSIDKALTTAAFTFAMVSVLRTLVRTGSWQISVMAAMKGSCAQEAHVQAITSVAIKLLACDTQKHTPATSSSKVYVDDYVKRATNCMQEKAIMQDTEQRIANQAWVSLGHHTEAQRKQLSLLRSSNYQCRDSGSSSADT